MHAVHDKPEIETLRAKNVAFIPASPGYKVTDNMPYLGSTCLEQLRYTFSVGIDLTSVFHSLSTSDLWTCLWPLTFGLWPCLCHAFGKASLQHMML